MKPLSGKALCRLLERHDWQLLRVQGSQRAGLSVPVHGNRPLKLGLQRHLLKLAGIGDEAP